MKQMDILYEKPMLSIIYLEMGDVITWSNQGGTIGDDNTILDNDDFNNLF